MSYPTSEAIRKNFKKAKVKEDDGDFRSLRKRTVVIGYVSGLKTKTIER